MLTFILCLISAWIAAALGFAVAMIIGVAKRADERDEAWRIQHYTMCNRAYPVDTHKH